MVAQTECFAACDFPIHYAVVFELVERCFDQLIFGRAGAFVRAVGRIFFIQIMVERKRKSIISVVQRGTVRECIVVKFVFDIERQQDAQRMSAVIQCRLPQYRRNGRLLRHGRAALVSRGRAGCCFCIFTDPNGGEEIVCMIDDVRIVCVEAQLNAP